MSASFQTRLWRSLATSMTIGAVGLGGYFFLVHEPSQAALASAQEQLSALEEQPAAGTQAAAEDTSTEDNAAAGTQAVAGTVAYLPPVRLAHACEALIEASLAHPAQHDLQSALFAIEELSRVAELEDYTIVPTSEPVHNLAVLQQIHLLMDGEGRRIQRLLTDIADSERAGALAQLELNRRDDTAPSDRRARRNPPPEFTAKLELRAYAVPNQDTAALERCQALIPEPE